MFFLILIFSLIMHIVTKFMLGMLSEFYDKKSDYLLRVIYCAIFSSVYLVRYSLNISATLYVMLFVYVIYELFLIISYCKCFIKFAKIEYNSNR